MPGVPVLTPSRRQRGAIGLMAAFVLFLVGLCTVLALDTGRLYMEQRNLQRVADLAALEAASRAQHGIVRTGDEELTGWAQESARRNGHDLSVADDQQQDAAGHRHLEARGGGLCAEGRRRHFYADRDADGQPVGHCSDGTPLRRQAVEVEAGLTTPASLFGRLLGDESVALTARAVARPRPLDEVVAFSVGSRLLSIEGSGLLGALLGEELAISALGYEGLARASLSLLELVELAAVAGTTSGAVEEIVLDVASLLTADIQALMQGAEGQVLDAGVAAFQEVLEILVSLGLDAIRLGDILDVASAQADAALTAAVALGELLEAMIFLGDSRHFLDVGQLGLDLGGLTQVQVVLNVIEPPRIAVGPVGCEGGHSPPCMGQWRTEARTAQLRLAVQAEVEVPLIARLALRVGVQGATARAGVEALAPASGNGQEHELVVAAYQQPLDVRLGVQLGLLNSPLSRIEEDLDGGGPLSSVAGTLGLTSLGPVGTLLGGVTGVVDSLLTALLGGYEYRIDPHDDTRLQRRGLGLLGIPISDWHHYPGNQAPAIEGGDDPQPGWSGDLAGWLDGIDGQGLAHAGNLGSRTVYWPMPDGEPAMAEFTGSAASLSGSLAGALEDVDISVGVLGVDAGLVGGVVASLSGFLASVLESVLTDLVAARLLDPLLDTLGVNVGEVEVRILDVEAAHGAAELVL